MGKQKIVEKRLNQLSESTDDELLFKGQVAQIIESINMGDVNLPKNTPHHVKFAYARTKSLASMFILESINTEGLPRQIDNLLRVFWLTVGKGMADRGYSGDPEDGSVPPHQFLVLGPHRKLNANKNYWLLLVMRAMALIAELEEAISLKWKGVSVKELPLIPLITADYIIEAQAALDAGLLFKEQSIASEDYQDFIEYYNVGIDWQKKTFPTEKRQKQLETIRDVVSVMERSKNGDSITTACWGVLSDAGTLPDDTVEAGKLFEALRKQVNSFKRNPETYLSNKPRVGNKLKRRISNIVKP